MHFSLLPYLDPGSGSLIIQIVIAALLGIGVAVRASWGSIKKLFGIKRWRNDSPFIKEYIRIDNEIFVYSIIATVVLILFSFERFERIENYKMQILLEDKANYTAKDLI